MSVLQNQYWSENFFSFVTRSPWYLCDFMDWEKTFFRTMHWSFGRGINTLWQLVHFEVARKAWADQNDPINLKWKCQDNLQGILLCGDQRKSEMLDLLYLSFLLFSFCCVFVVAMPSFNVSHKELTNNKNMQRSCKHSLRGLWELPQERQKPSVSTFTTDPFWIS